MSNDTKHASVRPGWSVPKPDIIPKPTAWPALMALGITLTAWGLVTSLVLVGVGVLVFGVSLTGWIGDIVHER
jgi:hypothetical protein